MRTDAIMRLVDDWFEYGHVAAHRLRHRLIPSMREGTAGAINRGHGCCADEARAC
jgi:hypothetical protein